VRGRETVRRRDVLPLRLRDPGATETRNSESEARHPKIEDQKPKHKGLFEEESGKDGFYVSSENTIQSQFKVNH
jgi:hypothetical protein